MSRDTYDLLLGLSAINAGLQVGTQYMEDRNAGDPYAFQRFNINLLGSTARIGMADSFLRHTGSPMGYVFNSFTPYTNTRANIFALGGGFGLGGCGFGYRAPLGFGFGLGMPMWGGGFHHHHHGGSSTSIRIYC